MSVNWPYRGLVALAVAMLSSVAFAQQGVPIGPIGVSNSVGPGGGFPITIGTTSIAAGSTTTTIAGLTLTAPAIGAATATSVALPANGGVAPTITTYTSATHADTVLITDNQAAAAALGIQNLSSTGTSGIEYIDNSSAVAVFAGYVNGGTGEFKVNNIAGSGFIDFKISNNTALTLSNGLSTVLNNAAIATNATDGFLYITTSAGTPTGTPTSFTGRVPLIFDTTNSQFWIFTGGSWKQPKTPAAAAIITWQ